MKFKDVSIRIKDGEVASRKNWSNRFIWLKSEFKITADKCFDPTLKALAIKYGEITGEPIFQEFNDGSIYPYEQSYEDIMSNDWSIIKIEDIL